MDHFSYFDWEKTALLELYSDYSHILWVRKLNLTRAAITLVDSDSFWGQWNSITRTISISRKLIKNYSWTHVVYILKHEMAHQLVDEMDLDERPHGDLFYQACQKLGLPEEYSRASINLQSSNLDWRENPENDVSNRMMDKVRKLLSLATSNNEHEALLAMNRVREIYAKYNLEEGAKSGQSNFVHLVVNLGKKRTEAHVGRIISILVGHFFVEVIMLKLYDAASGEHHAAFEIIGTKENAMMAEYVYYFLLRETEFLLDQAVSKKTLTRVQRKSYRLGILSGFSKKLTQTEQAKANTKDQLGDESTLISRALAKFKADPQLDNYLSKIYPRLSRRHTGSQYIDGSIFSEGQVAGHKITLNKPVTSTDEKSIRYLE